MAKSIRIRTTPNGGDKYIKIKLEQSFDFLEILSLKINQARIYRKFSSDYGVIAGRVIANRGFGVPNAKVSIFIPLDENENDPEIIGRYPFKAVTDEDSDGRRYNLLEDNKQHTCHTVVGTFPNKRKVLDNDVWLEIYDTYYKYTTTTNEAGDYMIFGVPIGNQKIHMDVDLSDIGHISIKPYDLIAQGYTENLFETSTTFKESTDLDSLVQLQKRDTNVNVLPFWGDSTEQEIGINRVDFNLGVDLTPTALFFGSIYTNQGDSGLHKGCAPRAFMGDGCLIKTGVGSVEAIRRISRDSNIVDVIGGGKIDADGNWAYSIQMNLDRVITDEFGNLVPSEDPTVGVPTRALMRFRIALDEYKFGFLKRSAHYLVPNMYNRYQFNDETMDEDMFELRWRKVYTVTNYIPRYQKYDILFDETPFHSGIKDIESCEVRPMPFNRLNFNVNPIFSILCVIVFVIGVIFDIINELLETIIFDVVMVIVCFFQHIFDGGLQGACRCRACFDLNDNSCPPYFNTTQCTCAACYTPDDVTPSYFLDVGQTFTGAEIINNVVGCANNGTYPLIPMLSTNGSGNNAEFTVIVSGGTVTSVEITKGGRDFQDMGGGNGEQVTLDFSNTLIDVCSGVTVQCTIVDHYTLTVGGVDCGTYNPANCEGECPATSCDIAFLPLECNGDEYFNGFDWAECTAENLAEDLDVIQYDFYNDWVIGSLYSYLFDYKVKSGIGGKSLERFCDFECRDLNSSPPADPNDPHRDNVCQEGSIYDKHYFVGNKSSFLIGDPTTFFPIANPPEGQVSDLFYKGLITEQKNFLYYVSRHDVDSNLSGTTGLSVDDKDKLLFATNLIELGSSVKCDFDGEPFIIDRLTSTSYKKDNGTQTLFAIAGCGAFIEHMNYDGWRLMSQAGVEITVAEGGRITGNQFNGDDGEVYEYFGAQSGLPDDVRSGGGILQFDRADTILRQHLCENFQYYNTVGVYSTTAYPTGGGSYVQSQTTVLPTVETQILSGVTDFCAGFEDSNSAAFKMPPFYTYFGAGKTSSLDKLKTNFFTPCIS